MERIHSISQQVTGAQQHLISTPNVKSADDVVIVSALRTCLSKAKRGPLKDTLPEVMLTHVLKETLSRSKIDPKLVEDLCVGNCLQPGAGAVTARAAQLMSGMPVTSTTLTINRQCSSGIEACSIIASKIKAGIIDCGIGGGVDP